MDGPQGPPGPEGPRGPTGSNGTTGQDIVEVYGTATLTVTDAMTSHTLIPGLETTVTVPPDALVRVDTNGGLQCTGIGTSFSAVNVAIRIDGRVTSAQRHVIVANTQGVTRMSGHWSFGRTFSLPPGAHSFQVVVADDGGSADANVSAANPPMQGVLTVMVLKR